MSELANILPPDDWLTRDERRLWLRRTAAYLAAGLDRAAAETEAMAELVMTGKLCRREFERTYLAGGKPADSSAADSMEKVETLTCNTH